MILLIPWTHMLTPSVTRRSGYATAMSFGVLVGDASMRLSCQNRGTENSLKRLRINSQDATEIRRLSKEDQMAPLVLRERARAGQRYPDCLLRLGTHFCDTCNGSGNGYMGKRAARILPPGHARFGIVICNGGEEVGGIRR